jgi:glycosyltransferase involved in cell wall biosynthesis
MRSVVMISEGIHPSLVRLQPWRYLHEVACQLQNHVHDVTIISNGESGLPFDHEHGLRILRIPTVNRYHWQNNPELVRLVEAQQPDVILRHVGITSYIHQHLNLFPSIKTVGIFPGVIYRLHDFKQVGMRNLMNEINMTWIHLVGACVPRYRLREPVSRGWLDRMVTLTHTTRDQLVRLGIPSDSIQAIPPGVDDIWFTTPHLNGGAAQIRRELGFQDGDKIVLYYGSPQPLRGLHDLIRALEIARQSDPTLKLLILSRRREDEFLKENASLRDLLEKGRVRQAVKVVSGFLEPKILVEYIAISDAVALPFQLVPADAPLSVLEALAQQKPVITTRVASLPEMAAGGAHFLAEPANPQSLAQAVLAAVEHTNSKSIDSSPALRRWRQVGEAWSQLVQSL